jgi:hypothetical protein
MNEWNNFLTDIERAKEDLSFENNEECFYRGHSDLRYDLIPGLFRDRARNKNRILEYEANVFYEFRSRARQIHNSNLSDWDILFYMQHHGCRTRLLDWTENLGVALYFAIHSRKNNTDIPTIWLLNPYSLNEKYAETRDLYDSENLNYLNEEEYYGYIDMIYNDQELWWDKPIALYPVRMVDRLTSQGGYFTIHGNDNRALNKQILGKQNIWRKVPLPLAAIDEAKKYLELFGINSFSMFPDLDGLAKYLNEKYEH